MRGKGFQSLSDHSSSPVNRSHTDLKFRHFFLGFAYALLLIFISVLFFIWLPLHAHHNKIPSISLDRASLDHLPEVVVKNSSLVFTTQKNCTYYTCFDVYKCSHTNSGKIGVYLYPLVEFVDEDKIPITKKISHEFYNVLKAISQSVYFTPDPEEACLFVPTLDLLNQNRIRPREVGKALASLSQ